MKNLFIITLSVLSLVSCTNSNEKSSNKEVKEKHCTCNPKPTIDPIHGEFHYYDCQKNK